MLIQSGDDCLALQRSAGDQNQHFSRRKQDSMRPQRPRSSPCRWKERSAGRRSRQERLGCLATRSGTGLTGPACQLMRSGSAASGLQSAAGNYRCCLFLLWVSPVTPGGRGRSFYFWVTRDGVRVGGSETRIKPRRRKHPTHNRAGSLKFDSVTKRMQHAHAQKQAESKSHATQGIMGLADIATTNPVG